MRRVAMGLLLAAAGLAHAANLADAQKHVNRIKAVSKEGAGNQEAGAAWKDLVALGIDGLFPALAGMDDASPTASNWLRSAVSAVAEKEKAAGRKLPADRLEAFVNDLQRAPAARRIAYELLSDIDSKAPERLLPKMLNDPSNEIRRDAVAAAFVKAEKLDGDPARTEYKRLFAAVRDEGQAKTIAEALTKLGVTPDFKAQFGLVTDWMLAGPFDSTKGVGFAAVYEPEKTVDLSATYKGKAGAEVKWKPHTVAIDPKAVKLEDIGVVDLKKALGHHKDAAAYAYTVIESDKEQPVEIRFGSITAVKVFLNGKPVFEHEEYHHGMG
ncbi:MAG: hypothetical protein J2P46_13980, partial [Zavarzinella sp.]|nr:hypothetical protein [Zavarzinella sp.]